MSMLPDEGYSPVVFPHQYLEFEAPVKSSHMVLYTRHLLGKLLTFVDAMVMDPQQRKAQKDMLKEMLWNEHGIVNEWMYEERTREVLNTTGEWAHVPPTPSKPANHFPY